ncbi:hypothetical protein ACFLRI_05565 [Bacteroidota bacterium]
MSMPSLPDFLGLAGVVLILIAYFLLQISKLNVKDLLYSFLNAIGAVLILVSLKFNLNLPSLVIELCWLVISIYGIFSAAKKRKER